MTPDKARLAEIRADFEACRNPCSSGNMELLFSDAAWLLDRVEALEKELAKTQDDLRDARDWLQDHKAELKKTESALGGPDPELPPHVLAELRMVELQAEEDNVMDSVDILNKVKAERDQLVAALTKALNAMDILMDGTTTQAIRELGDGTWNSVCDIYDNAHEALRTITGEGA